MSIAAANICILVISFSFYIKFKQKTEVIPDQKPLLVTELNKFRVIGPLHFHRGILPSHVAKLPFQKPQ